MTEIKYTRENPKYKDIEHPLGFMYVQKMYQTKAADGRIWWNMIPFTEEELNFISAQKIKAKRLAKRRLQKIFEQDDKRLAERMSNGGTD